MIRKEGKKFRTLHEVQRKGKYQKNSRMRGTPKIREKGEGKSANEINGRGSFTNRCPPCQNRKKKKKRRKRKGDVLTGKKTAKGKIVEK